jgi:hypothetical protein
MFDSVFGKNPPQKGGPLKWEPTRLSPLSPKKSNERPASYTKVFRWRLPDGQSAAPKSVELVGSFTNWQKVPLSRDGVLDAFHVTIHHIPSHQTHHYMLLVDGKPAQDKNCDGLAVPHGPQEEQFALQTDRGPRVFMLFAQTK